MLTKLTENINLMWRKMSNHRHAYKYQFIYLLHFFRNNFLSQKTIFTRNNRKLLDNFLFAFNLYKATLSIVFWTKVRTIYYVNNWIYTTNHKRIAVNYFWFVILSGIVGMVLATLIRLEFAYPGVGIFAGDSLQYLSLATAHGVIMVFFMIMPLLFGAFANFLLPTQLGVHDVAFPRLNSAAFWFLPGGLLMLCQLVCVDRRYQRMNCFNIREIQSILKRKFFTDLINTHDHRILLDKTALGVRFKTNNLNSINSNIFVFYNYGIDFTAKVRHMDFFSISSFDKKNVTSFNPNSVFYNLIEIVDNFTFLEFFSITWAWLTNWASHIDLSIVSFKNLVISSWFTISALTCSTTNFIYFLCDLVFYITNPLFSCLNAYLDFEQSLNSIFFDNNIPVRISSNDFIMYVIYVTRDTRIFLRELWLRIDDWHAPFHYYDHHYFWHFRKNIEHRILSADWVRFYLDFKIFYPLQDLFFFIPYLKHTNVFIVMFEYVRYVFYWLNLHRLLPKPRRRKEIAPRPKASHFFGKAAQIEESFSVSGNKRPSFALFEQEKIVPTSRFFFSNKFYSTLNYDSWLVHIYILVYIIINLPVTLFQIIKSFFDPAAFIIITNEVYEFIVDWYIPSLLDENLLISFFVTNDIYFHMDLKDYGQILPELTKFFFFRIYSDYFTFAYSQFSFSFVCETLCSIFFHLSSSIVWIFQKFMFYFIQSVNLLSSLIFGQRTVVLFNGFYDSLVAAVYPQYVSNQLDTGDSLYTSNYFNNSDLSIIGKYSNEELSESSRYWRFSNPVFKYDYKSGDYFPKLYKEIYTYLFNTIGELTGGLRPAPWFLSDKYPEIFKTNFFNYLTNVLDLCTLSKFSAHGWSSSRFSNTDGFYNFFFTLSQDFDFTNKKWVAMNSLNQKFYRMFHTSSMQQRIYNNWRQLKFTREAWRCKLLAARHQKTLFRRYVHEDGVFWSIERNARDLLPGWAMITPFSSRTRFTAIGKTDIGLMGVLLVLNSSIISAANFLVTYRYLSTLNNRKMRDARAFFTEAVMVSSWMMLAANPMLVIGIIMLLSDRHWQTSFFDYSGGGDTVLFQHMFWFFGHPEVYIIIIPTFGFTNTILSYYLKKRISARASLLYSMYTIAFLGFFVWGHHMYMVGLAHTTRMLFSTLTVMISVPAATKIMHWCVTIVNSAFATELPLLFIITFIFFFVSGGISGMCVAHTGMDVLFHDTFYVIAHFHVMLAGSAMFACFGAFYFYFPAIFGVKYSRIYAYLHYSYYLLGQMMTVVPMFWLGYAGMPRRVLDYPASMGGWHSVISSGHMLSVAGLMAFFIMIFDSLRQGKAVVRNTFGISRYNTRLNFYLYEIARLVSVQHKGLSMFKLIRPASVKLNGQNFSNFEPYETVLISYAFVKK